jgi:GAF domain-containing protein
MWHILASRGLSQGYSQKPFLPDQSYDHLRSEPFVVPDVSCFDLARSRQELYQQEGICSFLVLPMTLRGEFAGSVTFYYRRPHDFSPQEIELGQKFVRMATAALETAEIREDQRHLREEGDLAARRAGFMAEAGAILSSSLDYSTTLASVARLIVPHLADWCAVDVLHENGKLQRLAVAHIDPDKVQLASQLLENFPPDTESPRGIYAIVREGRTHFQETVTEEMLLATARSPAHLETLRRLAVRSAIVVPLIARERTLGAITLVSAESGRQFTPADVSFAEGLAYRAALAIDNTRLYQEAQHAAAARASAEQTMRLALDAADAWSWELDPASGKLWRSREVGSIYTASPRILRNIAGVLERVHPDDREKVRSVLSDTSADHREREVEYRVCQPDGNLRWLW